MKQQRGGEEGVRENHNNNEHNAAPPPFCVGRQFLCWGDKEGNKKGWEGGGCAGVLHAGCGWTPPGAGEQSSSPLVEGVSTSCGPVHERHGEGEERSDRKRWTRAKTGEDVQHAATPTHAAALVDVPHVRRALSIQSMASGARV